MFVWLTCYRWLWLSPPVKAVQSLCTCSIMGDVMFSHNGASGPESRTIPCFVEFAKWQHRGRVAVCTVLLHIVNTLLPSVCGCLKQKNKLHLCCWCMCRCGEASVRARHQGRPVDTFHVLPMYWQQYGLRCSIDTTGECTHCTPFTWTTHHKWHFTTCWHRHFSHQTAG